MKQLALAATLLLLLAGCGDDEGEARRDTLEAMEAEMPEEDRAMICDGYDHAPDTTYFAFASRWESIFAIDPPSEEEFARWLGEDVCPGLSDV